MSDKKQKYYKARTQAILSLQFWKNKEGTPQFTITCNPENDNELDNIFNGVDLYLFARDFFTSELLNLSEVVFFINFFKEVEKQVRSSSLPILSERTIPVSELREWCEANQGFTRPFTQRSDDYWNGYNAALMHLKEKFCKESDEQG